MTTLVNLHHFEDSYLRIGKSVNLHIFLKLILNLHVASHPFIEPLLDWIPPPGPPMMVAEVSDTGQMDLLRLLNTQVSDSNNGQREAVGMGTRSYSLSSGCWV